MNLLNNAVQMWGGFLVDDERVRSSTSKPLDEILRRRNHQVHFEHQARDRSQALDSERTERDVRDKAPVHDVDLDTVNTGRFNSLDLFSQPGEVR